MKNSEDIKSVVKEKYADIARNTKQNTTEDCGCGCCGESQTEFTILQNEYRDLNGYVAEADLNLGCGLPTQYAGINAGDTVLDLGSGAGNDVFIARSIVGESGHVIGLDMTSEMIEKAISNNRKLGFNNVEFKLGEIENMPLERNSVDVVVSNCVLNLVPDKNTAFKEIYRVLKPGGHFCVSDIVTMGDLPEDIRQSAELYVGCVSGAVKKEEYLEVIEKNGFRDLKVHVSKEIPLPDEMLREFLNHEQFAMVKNSDIGIISITVSGYKN